MPGSSFPHERLTRYVIAFLLSVHVGLLGWSSWRHTPVASEMAHLASGVSHLELNRFDLLSVNPPLIRSVASLPVIALSPSLNWRSYDPDPLSRSEHSVGRDFLNANGNRAFWMLTLARWMCIPFSVIGGMTCYYWGQSVYGTGSGVLALLLWCLSPFVLGHGALMICDAHATALGLAACYTFRRWLVDPTWRKTLGIGAVLGAAILSKSTLLLLSPACLFVWIVARASNSFDSRARSVVRECWMVGTIGLVSTGVINLGYGCDGSFRRLDSYVFYSISLRGEIPDGGDFQEGGNRFMDTYLGSVRVPLPQDFIKGLDKQKSDFDQTQLSFVVGQWQDSGSWYYYLYGLAIKEPLGLWVLALLAVFLGICHRTHNACLGDELMLLVPPIVVLVVASAHTGFNHHLRYVLPALPFVFIYVSKSMKAIAKQHAVRGVVVAVSVAWFASSSLFVYPHSFSYFNELIGGPLHGAAHVSESNLAWGQDLSYLAGWLRRHPEVTGIGVVDCAYFDIRMLGIDSRDVPVGHQGVDERPSHLVRIGPQPGWYAINVCRLPKQWREYHYFRNLKAVAHVAYSFRIYHITLQQANRIRREQGLPEIPTDWHQAKFQTLRTEK